MKEAFQEGGSSQQHWMPQRCKWDNKDNPRSLWLHSKLRCVFHSFSETWYDQAFRTITLVSGAGTFWLWKIGCGSHLLRYQDGGDTGFGRTGWVWFGEHASGVSETIRNAFVDMIRAQSSERRWVYSLQVRFYHPTSGVGLWAWTRLSRERMCGWRKKWNDLCDSSMKCSYNQSEGPGQCLDDMTEWDSYSTGLQLSKSLF